MVAPGVHGFEEPTQSSSGAAWKVGDSLSAWVVNAASIRTLVSPASGASIPTLVSSDNSGFGLEVAIELEFVNVVVDNVDGG